MIGRKDSVRRMKKVCKLWADSDWWLIGVLIGVIGIGRAALGLQSYPYGDDMVYGPLARLAIDPSLYPGDEQLRSFDNHAWLYGLIWRAADATIGVVQAHMALTVALTVLVGLIMLWIAQSLGAAGRFVPLAFLIANVVDLRGVGRGAYGGAIGDHFHLQSLAICFSLLAFLAILKGRGIWAGCALGLAALAQPVLAFHAAVAIGCFYLPSGWRGLKHLSLVGVTSILIASPVLAGLSGLDLTAAYSADSIVRDGYLWRADHHYLLPRQEYLLFSLYGVLGFVAARLLGKGVGLNVGLAIFGGLSFGFYAYGFGRQTLSSLPYVLDLSRSSPLLWVVSAAFASAAAEKAWARGDRGSLFLIGAPIFAIVAANYQWSGVAVFALIISLMPVLGEAVPKIPRLFFAGAIAVAGTGAVIVSVITTTPPLDRDPNLKDFYLWARKDSRPDGMFVAPPFIADIREFAQRSVWVDFRAVSMAQPDQMMESRRRHEAITPGFEALPPIGGWQGARLWTLAYVTRHTTMSVVDLLRRTGADYFVTYVSDTSSEIAGAGLKIAYADDHVLVLELRRP